MEDIKKMIADYDAALDRLSAVENDIDDVKLLKSAHIKAVSYYEKRRKLIYFGSLVASAIRKKYGKDILAIETKWYRDIAACVKL